MAAPNIGKAISAVIAFSMFLIIVLFINFMLRRADTSVGWITMPSRLIHLALGPLLVALNGTLLIYVCALYRTPASGQEVADLQASQQYLVLGFLANPFYISRNQGVTAVGYAFLIVLWWLGMHSFLYSLGLNPESPWLFGWQVLIGVVYLALGLATMLAIQACWQKFGIAAYQWKIWAGFIGIPIGAFLPPVLLRLGLPSFGL